MLYFPHIAQGMVIKAGRYISPPDIEAQLAPDNYLFTHSLMFTFDCYTQTGITAAIKLNDRWTTAQGWFSGQLLNHNRLYGFDLVEAYGLVYIPSVAQGMVIKFGRYISPPDIEAQLAPDNYLYTHSLMFTFDCYTQTGINASIKLNDQWSILFGIHAGDDIAPWNGCSSPNSDGHGSVGIKEQQRLPMGWHRFLERRQVQGWTR